jgi:hypothetical protein
LNSVVRQRYTKLAKNHDGFGFQFGQLIKVARGTMAALHMNANYCLAEAERNGGAFERLEEIAETSVDAIRHSCVHRHSAKKDLPKAMAQKKRAAGIVGGVRGRWLFALRVREEAQGTPASWHRPDSAATAMKEK